MNKTRENASLSHSLINPPPPNSEVDKNMQNEILQALKTEIQQNNADSTDSESDTDQTTSR